MKTAIKPTDPRAIVLDPNNILLPMADGSLWHVRIPPDFPREPATWTELHLPEKEVLSAFPLGPIVRRWSDR